MNRKLHCIKLLLIAIAVFAILAGAFVLEFAFLDLGLVWVIVLISLNGLLMLISLSILFVALIITVAEFSSN